MFKLFFILILRLNFLIPRNVSSTFSYAHQTKSILPLVLIRTEDGKLIRPTDIPRPVTDLYGNILFGTRFSAENEGKQLFFCGRDPSEIDIRTPTDGNDDNSDDQYFSYELCEPEPEPEPGSSAFRINHLQCAHEPEPFVLKLTERNDSNEKKEIYCGSVLDKEGEMYAFVYKVKPKDDDKTHIFEVYRFCYNEKEQKVLFTEHTIASPKLLNPANQDFAKERIQTYDISVEGYRYFGATFENIAMEYIEFEKQKTKQKWSEAKIEDSNITLKFLLSDQKLVPSEDMAFASWRKTTFHCLNAKLMEDEKIPVWNHISELIRKDAINKSREYLVRTGAFDITNEGKDENELIQSPDFWIKLVSYKNEDENSNESLAIVMIHNPKIKQVVNTFNDICKKNECETFAEPFTVPGTSVCCTFSMTEVGVYFRLKLSDHMPLEIDSLCTVKQEVPEVVHEEIRQEVPSELQTPDPKVVHDEIPSELQTPEVVHEEIGTSKSTQQIKAPQVVHEEIRQEIPSELQTPDPEVVHDEIRQEASNKLQTPEVVHEEIGTSKSNQQIQAPQVVHEEIHQEVPRDLQIPD